MGVIFGGGTTNNGSSTNLLLIMWTRLSQKTSLHDLKNQTRFLKWKCPGTTYENYSLLLRNFYHTMYTHITTTQTHMSKSWVCVFGGFLRKEQFRNNSESNHQIPVGIIPIDSILNIFKFNSYLTRQGENFYRKCLKVLSFCPICLV